MRTGIKHKVLAILTALLMVFAMMPVTALADDSSGTIKIPEGEICQVVNPGETVENHGTIVTNNGIVVSNDGTITTNNGTVTSSASSGTITDNYGTVSANHGTITNNYGSVSTNDITGKVIYNKRTSTHTGAVNSNYGNVYGNDGVVSSNYGTIDFNRSTLQTNEEDGTVGTNTGDVTNNKGTIGTNENYPDSGTVFQNNGKIESNKSTVSYNSGTVDTNQTGGTVNNMGIVSINYGEVYNNNGTVGSNISPGTEYLPVSITNRTAHTSISCSGLKNGNDLVNWLGEVGGTPATATITLIPEDGYEINEVTGLPGNVSAEKNADGTWTLTISSGTKTSITIPESTAKKYTVTVDGGSGGGDHATGSLVTVRANDPPDGQRFKEWTGADGLIFTYGTSATTSPATFTMPARAVNLTATYEDIPPVTYAVTVTGGSGGGDYAAGASVTITANAAETGKRFNGWTGADGLVFTSGNATTSTVTFTMPARAVNLTATYEDIPPVTYAVTVTGGSGGGDYAAGASVTITADEPEPGKQFAGWTTEDDVTLADATAAETTFVMPAKAVTVAATYEDIPAPPEPQEPLNIQDAEVVLSKTAFTYNGAVQKPEVKTIGGKTLMEGRDYKLSWSDESSKNAGTYSVTITGKGDYTGIAKATYTINKAANPLTVKAKIAKVKAKKLKKKNQTLAVSKVMTVSKGQGPVTYKLASVSKSKYKKYFKVNAKTGKVTVKKKLKKGTYKLRINVTAAGNGNYNKVTKTVTVKIKVK